MMSDFKPLKDYNLTIALYNETLLAVDHMICLGKPWDEESVVHVKTTLTKARDAIAHQHWYDRQLRGEGTAEEARAFLLRAGIINPDGTIHKNYTRGEEDGDVPYRIRTTP